jgi:hypothetical protein
MDFHPPDQPPEVMVAEAILARISPAALPLILAIRLHPRMGTATATVIRMPTAPAMVAAAATMVTAATSNHV